MVYHRSLQDSIRCYPVPLNPDEHNLTISYFLKKPAETKITVVSPMGSVELDAVLRAGEKGARQYYNAWPWNGRGRDGKIPEDGVYWVFIRSGGEQGRKKIMIIR